MNPDKAYQLSESEILRLSYLFRRLEEAVIELIRSRTSDADPVLGVAEMSFYEEIAEPAYVYDERQISF